MNDDDSAADDDDAIQESGWAYVAVGGGAFTFGTMVYLVLSLFVNPQLAAFLGEISGVLVGLAMAIAVTSRRRRALQRILDEKRRQRALEGVRAVGADGSAMAVPTAVPTSTPKRPGSG